MQRLGGPIHLLVNPAAGGGRAGHSIDRAYAALRTVGPVELVESTCAGDERRLAGEAHQARARALVVLGGDGSLSHAARGLIAARSATPLCVFAAGTGNDFAKSLGVPAHNFLAMARRLEAGTVRSIDAGEIDGVTFINAAGFGFDVDVLQRMREPRRRPLLRGTPRYVVTALQQLFRYSGLHATVPVLRDGASSHWLTVVFANGQWFGGAFHIAPAAHVSDGTLDLVGIADASPLTRAGLFARALRGKHLSHRAVHTQRGTAFVITFVEPPHFQADGELHQASGPSVSVRCLPQALRVVG